MSISSSGEVVDTVLLRPPPHATKKSPPQRIKIHAPKNDPPRFWKKDRGEFDALAGVANLTWQIPFIIYLPTGLARASILTALVRTFLENLSHGNSKKNSPLEF
jgi:hypothetical protein